MAKCAATTKEGRPCQNPTPDGEKYCHIHRRNRRIWQIAKWSAVMSVLLGILAFVADVSGILEFLGFDPVGQQVEEKLLDLQAEAARLERWKQIPISDLTIGFSLDQAAIQMNRNNGMPSFVQLMVGLDQQPLVILPPVEVDDLYLNWNEEVQVRISVRQFLPDFPETVGDLIGHELKVQENDVRPWTIIDCVYFYHRYRATNPFLVLEEVGHQYAGACYFRVWYPSQSVITRLLQ
jgi:hypothetical protein